MIGTMQVAELLLQQKYDESKKLHVHGTPWLTIHTIAHYPFLSTGMALQVQKSHVHSTWKKDIQSPWKYLCTTTPCLHEILVAVTTFLHGLEAEWCNKTSKQETTKWLKELAVSVLWTHSRFKVLWMWQRREPFSKQTGGRYMIDKQHTVSLRTCIPALHVMMLGSSISLIPWLILRILTSPSKSA